MNRLGDRSVLRTALLALALLALLNTPAATAIALGAPNSISSALRMQLEPKIETPVQRDAIWATLRKFYAHRNYDPIWCSRNGPRRRAHEAVAAFAAAAQEGLDPRSYGTDAIKQCGAVEAGAAAKAELALSRSFVRYGREVRGGRLAPAAADPSWHIDVDPIDTLELLQQAAQSASLFEILSDLPPPQRGYRQLRDALHRYQDLADKGGWPMLPTGPTLEPGMRHPQVRVLRRRLQVTGDLVVPPILDAALFDAPLTEAVYRFQDRHGLQVDGIVGPATRAAANVSVQQRVEQLQINMERLRWLPRDLGKRYVMVNMAGFWLHVIEDNKVVLSMPVIVGKPYRSTPTFSGFLSSVVFNPEWVVPPRIANEDLVPKQRRDPHYFLSQRIRVFSDWSEHPDELDPSAIDWSRYRTRSIPFKLVQEPGPRNSLGRIKFMFANRFGIYLHDTPARRLFAGAVRTHSSGCIRVAKPIELAVYVLSDAETWSEEAILTRILTGDTGSVSLPDRIPIYLIYQTAWVAGDGAIHFRDDVYGRDARLRAQLQRRLTALRQM